MSVSLATSMARRQARVKLLRRSGAFFGPVKTGSVVSGQRVCLGSSLLHARPLRFVAAYRVRSADRESALSRAAPHSLRRREGGELARGSCEVGIMTASTPAAGRIFISYRREETAYPAGWLYDRLVEHFGQGQVFKDVDSIELGDDFVEVISAAVAGCDVLLALIGDQWLTVTGEGGRRRLEDPDDFVRLEVEAALTRNVRVIPVLVDDAQARQAGTGPEVPVPPAPTGQDAGTHHTSMSAQSRDQAAATSALAAKSPG